MMKSILFAIGLLCFQSTSFSQADAEDVLKQINESNCKEVIMVSSRVEKKYVGEWFNSLEVKDDMLQFSKGENIHQWNPEQIVFIEKTSSYVRIYLN